jgi:adenylate kinase
MGRPGSGKGAQSERLAKRLGSKVFSTGNRLREIAKEPTPFGRKLNETIGKGGLAPLWFASFLFEQALLELEEGESIVFEGVCRKEQEAKLFAEICEWLNRDFKVLYLDVSEDTVIERLNKRKVIEGREDDSYIRERFKLFDAETFHSVEFFKSIGKVIEINGEPPQDEVEKEIMEKLSIN